MRRHRKEWAAEEVVDLFLERKKESMNPKVIYIYIRDNPHKNTSHI